MFFYKFKTKRTNYMLKKILILIIFIIIVCANLFSQIPQGMPLVSNYTDEHYYASTQNWFAIQDKQGFMYFANSSGILIFDGLNWTQVSVNNKTARAMAIDKNGKIWVGAKRDLGFLDIDSLGNIIYVSILEKIPEKYRNFNDVWKVYVLENNEIFFFTKKYLMILNNNEFSFIETQKIDKTYFRHSFQSDDKVFIQEYPNKLYIFKDKKLNLIDKSPFDSIPIKAILPVKNKGSVFLTEQDGAFIYKNSIFEKIETPIDDIIYNKIYKAFTIGKNYYAISLLNRGLIIVDHNFNLIKTINTDNKILSNSIYHVFLDRDNNIWLSTDHGISFFSLLPSYTLWGVNFGLNAKTKTSAFYNKYIYIGNSSGIYYYKLYNSDLKNETIRQFKPIMNNDEATTYYMQVHNGFLLGASQKGFFQIKNNIKTYIIKKENLRNFILYDSTTIIIGGNRGIHLVKFINENWVYKHKIRGFDGSCLYMQTDENKNIWVSDYYLGVKKLILDSNKQSVLIHKYDASNGLKNLPQISNNFIFKINNDIVVATKKGVYRYDNQNDMFVPFNEINIHIKNLAVLMIFSDSHNNLWLKVEEIETKNRQKVKVWNLIKLELQKDGSYKLEKNIFKLFQSKIFSFNQINDSLFLIGNKKGFTIYNNNKDRINNFPCLIRSFEYIVNRDSAVTLYAGVKRDSVNYFSFSQNEITDIKYINNSIRFSFSALDYNNNKSLEFSCYLDGFDNNWTSWSTENIKEYTNLREGEYQFYVKARNVYDKESTPAKYTFVVKAPWYRTIYAYLCYIIIGIFFFYLSFRLYSRGLRKRKEYLEKIVKIRTSEISQQNEEIITQNDMLSDKNEEINRQKNEIELQRDIAYKQKKEITDSIIYAKRIQIAIFPKKEYLKKNMPEHFILFKPRDIVSGDYYWINKIENKLLIVTADSTGHGVPGAFMSMLGISLLNEILAHHKINQAGETLDVMRDKLKESLHQEGKKGEAQDGYDLSFYILDTETLTLSFSGAFNSIYIIDKDKNLSQLKADRQPIAIYIRENKFTTHNIQLQKGDTIYSFSDGYVDQFGGNFKNTQKFRPKRFKNLLLDIQDKSLKNQKIILNNTFETWRDKEPQIDDVVVIGVKV